MCRSVAARFLRLPDMWLSVASERRCFRSSSSLPRICFKTSAILVLDQPLRGMPRGELTHVSKHDLRLSFEGAQLQDVTTAIAG
jgi:hypothetical protein